MHCTTSYSRHLTAGESRIAASSYRRPPRFTSRRKEGAALCYTPIPGDTQPEPQRRSDRLLDRLWQTLHTKNYDYSTEQAYAPWVRRDILLREHATWKLIYGSLN